MKEGIINRAVLSIYVIAVVFIGCGSPGVRTISVEELGKRIDAGEELHLLDTRTLDEYYGSLGHLPGALLIPHTEIESRLGELEEWKEQEIIVYCRSGRRSLIASEILKSNGYNPVNVSGGMIAWRKAFGASK